MAPTFKFLHAADLHLDSPLRGLARRAEAAGNFVEASRRALENLVAAAIGEKVAFLIVAGDLYDGDWRDYATGQFFVRQMGHLAREGIRVFLLRGNHDADSVITKSLPLPPNVHNFSVRGVETVRIEELGVALHGRGFAHRHVTENVAATYPGATPDCFNIGVLHSSLTGRDGHDVYAPCAIDDLTRTGYDYWALGHVHHREIVAEYPHIIFPGNLQGRHARETGPKGATLVRVVDGRVAGVEALALDAARFEHILVDLDGAATQAELAQRARSAMTAAHMSAEGRPLALRVTLSGETPLSNFLFAHPGQAHEDLQALAFEIGAELLIEKIRNATFDRRPGANAVMLTGFDEIMAEVAADPGFRADVVHALTELRSKAPIEALRLLQQEAAEIGEIAAAAIEAAQRTALASLKDAVEPEARK